MNTIHHTSLIAAINGILDLISNVETDAYVAGLSNGYDELSDDFRNAVIALQDAQAKLREFRFPAYTNI